MCETGDPNALAFFRSGARKTPDPGPAARPGNAGLEWWQALPLLQRFRQSCCDWPCRNRATKLPRLCATGRNGPELLLSRTLFSRLIHPAGRFGVDVPIGGARVLAGPGWLGQVAVDSLLNRDATLLLAAGTPTPGQPHPRARSVADQPTRAPWPLLPAAAPRGAPAAPESARAGQSPRPQLGLEPQPRRCLGLGGIGR